MTVTTDRRPGYILIVVLIVIVVLSLTAYQFADAMAAEYRLAVRKSELTQAKTFAASGIHYTMGLLANRDTMSSVLNNNPYDNPDVFSNVTITDEGPRGGARFSIFSVVEGSSSDTERFSVKNGVTDESGKINLNTMMRIDSSGEVLRAMLILLPNMTDDVADAIVDWLDADDDQRENGAEAAAYTAYRPRNGPINSLDELLFVRGVTVANLYGNDTNRNGILDASEAANSAELDRGWADYLTVYGHELNVDSTGQPRVYVNDTNFADVNAKLAAVVGQELADYTIAYRLYSRSNATGPPPANAGSPADLRTAVQTSLSSGTARAQRRVTNSMLSMVGTQVTLPRPPGAPMNAPQQVVRCPLNDEAYLKSIMPLLLDKVTAKSNHELNPRINVNTCSPTLFAVLPGVTPDLVSSSVATRSTLDPASPEYRTGAWLYTQAGMNIEIFKNLEAYITGTTMTYRIQSLGYFAKGGPVARVEAVIDIIDGHPRIVYFRDLSELGAGFTVPRE